MLSIGLAIVLCWLVWLAWLFVTDRKRFKRTISNKNTGIIDDNWPDSERQEVSTSISYLEKKNDHNTRPN